MNSNWNPPEIIQFFERYPFVTGEQIEVLRQKNYSFPQISQNILRVLNELKIRDEHQRNFLITDWNEILLKQLKPSDVLNRKTTVLRGPSPVTKSGAHAPPVNKVDLKLLDDDEDAISDIFFFELEEINKEVEEAKSSTKKGFDDEIPLPSSNASSRSLIFSYSASQKNPSSPSKNNNNNNNNLLETIEELHRVIEIVNNEKFDLQTQVQDLQLALEEEKRLTEQSSQEMKDMERENNALMDENFKLNDALAKFHDKYEKLKAIQKRATIILKNNNPTFSGSGKKSTDMMKTPIKEEVDEDDEELLVGNAERKSGSRNKGQFELKRAFSFDTAELITMEEDLMMMMSPAIEGGGNQQPKTPLLSQYLLKDQNFPKDIPLSPLPHGESSAMKREEERPSMKTVEIQTDPIHSEYIRRSMISAIKSPLKPNNSNASLNNSTSSNNNSNSPYLSNNPVRRASQIEILNNQLRDDQDLIPQNVTQAALEYYDLKTLQKQFLNDREIIQSLTKEKTLLIQFYDMEMNKLKSEVIDEKSNYLQDREKFFRSTTEKARTIRELERKYQQKEKELERLQEEITLQSSQKSQEEDNKLAHLNVLQSIHEDTSSAHMNNNSSANNNNNNSNINMAKSPSHANSSNNNTTTNNVNKKHLINTRHRKIVAKKDENPQQSLVSPPSSSNVGQSILNTAIALGASPTTNIKKATENSLETHSFPEHQSLVLEEKDSRISQLEKEKNELVHQTESLTVTNNLLKENISNLSMQLQSSLVENQKFLEKIKFLEDRVGDGNSNYNYNYPRPNITLEMSDITDQNNESPLRRRRDAQEKDNNAMNYNSNQMQNHGNNLKMKDNNNSYHFKYDGFDHGTDEYYYNNGHPNTNNLYRNNNYYLQTSSLSPMPVPATALENSIDNGQDYAQIPNPDYYYHPYPMMTGEEEGEFYDPLCADEEDEGEEYDEEQKERSQQQRKALRKDDSFFLTQEKWIKKESMYLANIHYLLELLQEMGQSYQFMVQQTQQMQQQQQQPTQGEWRPSSPSHRNNNSSNQEPESERPLPRPPSKKQFLQQQQHDRQQDSQKEILSRLVESNYSFLHKQQQKLAQQKHLLLQQQRQQFQQQQNQLQQPRQDYYPIDGQFPNLLKEHILETNITNTTPRSATSGLSNSTGGGGNDGKQKPRYQLGLKKTEPPIKKGKLVSPPFITMVRPRSANYNGNTTGNNNNNNQMNHYFQNYAYYDQLIDLDLLHAFTPRSNVTGAVSQKPNINNHNEIIINQTTSNNPQAPRRPRSANSATRNRSHSPTSRPTSSKSSQQHIKSQSHVHHNPARKIVGYDFPVRELIQNIGNHFSDV
jgi:hypothetical protein